MKTRKTKMAAALAAVNTYLQQEEDEASSRLGLKQDENVNQEMHTSQWSQSGRVEQMNMRRLIQLRIFDRFR